MESLAKKFKVSRKDNTKEKVSKQMRQRLVKKELMLEEDDDYEDTKTDCEDDNQPQSLLMKTSFESHREEERPMDVTLNTFNVETNTKVGESHVEHSIPPPLTSAHNPTIHVDHPLPPPSTSTFITKPVEGMVPLAPPSMSTTKIAMPPLSPVTQPILPLLPHPHTKLFLSLRIWRI